MSPPLCNVQTILMMDRIYLADAYFAASTYLLV
jgi:hypothetical protein